MAKRRIYSLRQDLIIKSREAALTAVQSFNNPLTQFKAEAFIVLMVIAWTYLLHAHYRGQGIDYRYFDQGPKRRKFDRTKAGAYKHWELERCLNDKACPLDPPTRSNLRFLIGLRHEIEHHRSAGVGDRFAGRYLACCLNYEKAITRLFGGKHSMASELTLALQFRDLTAVPEPAEATDPLPANVAKYVQEFDAALPEEEFQSPSFSYRLLFTRKLTNKKGQADRVIEFISSDSDLAKTIDKEYWVRKDVERPKHLPKEVVTLMKTDGYPRFSMHYHTQLWKKLDAKNPGKGYGVMVANTWYWYDPWIDEVRKHCAGSLETYGPLAAAKASGHGKGS